MAELIIVRHGQANSHATDSESYDKLSDLGHQQARWLGEHFGTTNPHFDAVHCGALLRHEETASSMGYAPNIRDPRLDELDYWALANALEAEHGIPAPAGPAEFAKHLPQVIDHWSRDTLESAPETFGAFYERVTNAIEEICTGHGRVLVVTSGGVIGVVLRHIMGLDNRATGQVMLQVMNSSFHRVQFVHDQMMLATFNATPHLDLPDRAHARTFV